MTTPPQEDSSTPRSWWLILALAFMATRSWLLFFFSAQFSDTRLYVLYYDQFNKLAAQGLDFLQSQPFDYPPLMLPLILIPGYVASIFGQVDLGSYSNAFRHMLFVCDVAILLSLPSLIRATCPNLSSRSAFRRAALYVPLPLLLPDLVYDRLDLLVAAVIVVALASLANKHRLAGAFLLGTAVALKIVPLFIVVPILLWRFFSSPTNDRKKVIVEIAVGIIGILAGFLPFYGSSGNAALGFLDYQGARGLQIESVAASLGMLGHQFGMAAAPYQEANAISLAFPGADILQTVFSALLVFSLGLFCLWIALKNSWATGLDGFGNALHAGIILTVMAILFSNVFSPQYLLWLMPLVVLLPNEQSFIRTYALYVIILVLTWLIFPTFYRELVQLLPFAERLMILRNVVFIAFFGYLLIIWKRTTSD